MPYQTPVPFSKAEVQSYPVGVSVYGARQSYLESLSPILYKEGGYFHFFDQYYINLFISIRIINTLLCSIFLDPG